MIDFFKRTSDEKILKAHRTGINLTPLFFYFSRLINFCYLSKIINRYKWYFVSLNFRKWNKG